MGLEGSKKHRGPKESAENALRAAALGAMVFAHEPARVLPPVQDKIEEVDTRREATTASSVRDAVISFHRESAVDALPKEVPRPRENTFDRLPLSDNVEDRRGEAMEKPTYFERRTHILSPAKIWQEAKMLFKQHVRFDKDVVDGPFNDDIDKAAARIKDDVQNKRPDVV